MNVKGTIHGNRLWSSTQILSNMKYQMLNMGRGKRIFYNIE